jgi:hypothetical protein
MSILIQILIFGKRRKVNLRIVKQYECINEMIFYPRYKYYKNNVPYKQLF